MIELFITIGMSLSIIILTGIISGLLFFFFKHKGTTVFKDLKKTKTAKKP